jgi:hypothetical protein
MFEVSCGSSPARLIVCAPAGRLKVMVSATTGVALAAVIASRSVVRSSPRQVVACDGIVGSGVDDDAREQRPPLQRFHATQRGLTHRS